MSINKSILIPICSHYSHVTLLIYFIIKLFKYRIIFDNMMKACINYVIAQILVIIQPLRHSNSFLISMVNNYEMTHVIFPHFMRTQQISSHCDLMTYHYLLRLKCINWTSWQNRSWSHFNRASQSSTMKNFTSFGILKFHSTTPSLSLAFQIIFLIYTQKKEQKKFFAKKREKQNSQ